jgi:hypothetical protein
MKANMINMNQGCNYAVIAGKNALFRATKLPNNFYNRILIFCADVDDTASNYGPGYS